MTILLSHFAFLSAAGCSSKVYVWLLEVSEYMTVSALGMQDKIFVPGQGCMRLQEISTVL